MKRVHELAKELGLSSKEVIERLRALGIEAKSHMSTVEDAAVERLRQPVAIPKSALARRQEPAAAPVAEAKAPEPKRSTVPPVEKRKGEPRPPPKPAAPAAAPVGRELPVQPKTVPVPPPQPSASPKPTAEPPKAPAVTKPPVPEQKTILIHGSIVVKELAEHIGLRPNQLIAELMSLNVLASQNERLDVKIAQKIAEKHGFTVEQEKRDSEHKPVLRKREEAEPTERPEDIEPRPPVVTFLGHVDHGKTSLLDRIRNSSVAKGEFGGITQHIGAYTVESSGRRITFLDTPGHEAFTAMRARGANLTDIAVIIVAADDGVMPQTVEAVRHAQAAGVPIMVAINKIDLPTANTDRVKQQLAGMNLTPEDWGGNVICCPVSAVTGKGIPELLEMILLQADMLELKANPKVRGHGFVIEARLAPGMGPTANLLIKNGTLTVGDPIICGPYWGRVRALINDHGIKLKSAGPSTPVQCLGLSGVPNAGAEFRVCASDRAARDQAEERMAQIKAEQMAVPPKRITLESLSQLSKRGESVELRLVLKADVQGSIEAMVHALKDIKSEKVSLNIILSAVGNITANDVLLAKASDAVVIGFHVAKEDGVAGMAKREGVDIRLHNIIYEMVEEVRSAMAGLLEPEVREKILGHAEIKQVFVISKGGKVAGCMVRDGRIYPRRHARLLRGGEVVFQGMISSLRRFQNDASEVAEGQECGIRLDNYSDFAPGDVIEVYDVEKIPQTL